MARSFPLNALYVLALLTASLGTSLPALAQSKNPAPSIPMVFEQNEGQASAQYPFLSRRNGVATLFQADGVDLFVPASRSRFDRLQIRLRDVNAQTKVEGVGPLPGQSNYLKGSDPARWVTHVPQFSGIKFAQIYGGIDLVFHGTDDDLENDFLLAAGADPSKIRFDLNWPARINSRGDLDIQVGTATVTLHKPVAYQQLANNREEVPAEFVLNGQRHVSFEVGAYDHARPLIIDPVFIFSTYLAGTSKDQINAITVDPTGNIYITGNTMSVDFPVENPEQPTCDMCGGPADGYDAFVSKLDPTGHTLLYSTYLGGSGYDSGSAIAIDLNSNIIVAGISTSSSDFPHAGSVKALTCQINDNCYFVSSIKPNGSGFNYSGLVGGIIGYASDNATGVIAVDGSGNVYLSGTTDDQHFQLTAGTLGPTFAGYPLNATFVLKLDPTGKLLYSTTIPGNSTDTTDTVNYVNNFPVHGIAVDTHGNVTLAGLAGLGLPTTSGVLLGSLPTPTQTNPFPMAGYVAQINATASALNFATYVTGTDDILGMTVDSAGEYFLTGSTNELNLPVSANAYQKTIPPGPDCACAASFVMKLDPEGKTALEATYLASPSGIPGTAMSGIALDTAGNVVLGGITSAPDFPLVNPFQASWEGTETNSEMVLAEFNPALSTLLFGSFLSSTTQPYAGSLFGGLALDSQNHLIVAGGTYALDFPTNPNSFQPKLPSGDSQLGWPHGFISKLDLSTAAPSVCLVTPGVNFGTVLVGAPATQSAVIKNCGNASLQISSLVSSSPLVTASQSCGAIAVGASCTVKLTYTPTDTTSVSGTITVNDNTAIGAQQIQFYGSGGLPQVYIPGTVSVYDLFVGTSASTELDFFNNGTVAWVVNSVKTTGDFSIANSCTTPLPPSTGGLSECTMSLTFSPTKAGARTGTLVIADNQPGSPHTISLSGNGLTAYTSPTIAFMNSIPTDAQPAQLQISGTNFFPGSQVIVNGSPRVTHDGYGTTIEADLTAADLAQPGELSVTVSNPAPGGGVSNTFAATVYGVVRNININHAVWVPSSGLLYATVSTGSFTHPNQVVAINPSTQAVVSAWSVGNGPNQIAVSGDGTLLYVGLDGDGTVAQIALPSGTVKFTVGLGTDPDFGKPLVADALRVLPGAPHSWVVTLCATAYVPCGLGVAVFDDAVERPTAFVGIQTQPDGLLFIGSNATNLFGTTFEQIPSTFYEFAINSSGITQTQAVNTSPQVGGGPLDTDGTSIYVNNGQVINPSTLAVTSTIPVAVGEDGIKVDVPASRVYYAGFGNLAPAPTGPSFSYGNFAVAAYGLTSQTLSGFVQMNENPGTPEVFRWGTNGIGLNSITGLFFLQTSITGTPLNSARLSVSGWSPTEVAAGSASVPLTITGTQFAAGDTLTANGTALTVVVVNSTEITSTIPSSLLASSGTLQLILSNPAKQTATFSISVTGAGSAPITISPTSLAFGNQTVGVKSAAMPVTVTNSGTAAITSLSIAMTGANTTSLQQTNNCPSSLAVAAKCTINVTFDPTGTGLRTASVTLTDNLGTQNVPATGTGVAPPISLSPTSLAFGNETVGVPAEKQVKVTNNSPSALSITNITVTGANTVSFQQTNNCGSGIAASASCTINVTFNPTGTGARSASVTLVDVIGTQNVPLTGTGVLAPIALTPTSIAFGNETVNVPVVKTVTVKNNQSSAITVTSITMTGANTVSFQQTNTCGSSIPASGSCTISVTFKPTGTGARSASVTLVDSLGTQNVPLTGTGVAAPITLSPASIAFGNETVNVPVSKDVTVTNTSSSAIAITSIAMTGANTVSFQQTNNCGSSIAKSGTCTIVVTFRPTGTGARSASVTLTDSIGTQNVPLTGTGVAP